VRTLGTKEILKRIHRDKSKKEITDRQIAATLEVTPGAVSQYFSGTIQISYPNFFKLVEMVYTSEKEKPTKNELLKSFLSVIKSKESLRLAMEHCDAQGNIDLLGTIVEKEKQSKNYTNKEWAALYELIYLRCINKLRGKSLLEALIQVNQKKNIKTIEMKILTDILHMYSLFDMEEYNSMFKITQDLIDSVKQIKNPFLQTSYCFRVKEIYAYAHLMSDNLEEARTLGKKLTGTDNTEHPLLEPSGYYILGQSYIFESSTKSIEYLEKGIEYLKKFDGPLIDKKRAALKSTLEFVKIYWGIELDSLDPIHPAEKAFLLFKKGEVEQAESILMDLEKKNGGLTPYQLYYLACIKNDANKMVEALSEFERRGNRFYSNLPKIKLGLTNPILN
jgi:transcriptional regulator with XRE-family HTH domain